jgi:hypothetical protein
MREEKDMCDRCKMLADWLAELPGSVIMALLLRRAKIKESDLEGGS